MDGSGAEPTATEDSGDAVDGGDASAAVVDDAEVEPEPEPESEQVLTAENNEDLAALLVLRDPGDPSVAVFASEYAGRNIMFEASIDSMDYHGGYTSRYDMLITAGQFSEDSAAGPSFQFEDVGIADLHLVDSEDVEYIGVRDNVRVVARVESFDDSADLLLLEPVSVEVL